MINNKIHLTADTSPLDDLGVPAADYSVALSVAGNRASDAFADFTFGGQSVCAAPQTDMYAMFSRVLGQPMHAWADIANGLGLSTSFPASYTTVQQNLAKATILVALWLEPSIIAEAPQSLESELVDTLVIDYSGTSDPQRYIYFPPQGLSDDIVSTLYRLHLLCRLRAALNSHPTVSRYFIPLVTPGVAPHWFDRVHPEGGRAYQAWRELRKFAARRVDRAVRRHQ